MTARREARPDSSREGAAIDGVDACTREPKENRGLPPVELGPIIKSKIQAPALRTSTLSRPRLIDQLRQATSRRLTLLIAEAGYGKTTLLADFASQSGTRTLWYRLDSTDADIITWTNHLIAAVRETEPDFGEATLRLMTELATGGPPKSAFITSLISELDDLKPIPTILVLEDFHAVYDRSEARELVAQLIKDGPPWLRIVVSSRSKPRIEVGRLAANDDYSEITTDDLRFTLDETFRLFANSYDLPLDDDVLQELDSKTRGWVASLQLFHGSIRGRPSTAVRALARQLSGASSPLYDFLAEEVLANLPSHLERLLLRASIIEFVTPQLVTALFAEIPLAPTTFAPTTRDAQEWIDEADRLNLLSRSSQTSDARQLHPLLRDFLTRQLRMHETDEAIRQMHLRVADSLLAVEPLTAAHHYLEAGETAEATRCLSASVLTTMGTGQAGTASDLIDRLKGIVSDPAVAAIRARKLLEQGELDAASEVLARINISNSNSDVRAVVRHARLALGWRNGDRDLMFETLREIQLDPEAPSILADIFQIYLDASPLSRRPITLSALAERMERMGLGQWQSGQMYYRAISLHNAAQTMLAAGRYDETRRLGAAALDAFEDIPHADVDRYSTHAVLAAAAFELGDSVSGEREIRAALASGLESGDVHAECAHTLAILGDTERATQLVLTATDLDSVGRSDFGGKLLNTFTRSLVEMPQSSDEARMWLLQTPDSMPLDMGYQVDRQMLIALSYLLSQDHASARDVAVEALKVAKARGARRTLSRLGVILAIANLNPEAVRRAFTSAAASGELAMLTVADGVAAALWLVPEVPVELRESIARWPRRWLPAIRRQLNSGGTPNAAVAARLLDEFGESSDLTRLKAFAKAYRKMSRSAPSLGTRLARRVAAPLEVSDLGRTTFTVGDRVVELGAIRRKASALLLFLVTRPGFAANREQTWDALWPETDPDAASNNLNQSLFFLRRDIDPWYEDELSVEYVGFQGDLVWLDPTLTRVLSVEFAARARAVIAHGPDLAQAMAVMSQYSGQFSPEFEYEEWAISWRTRVHALFLELTNASIRAAVKANALETARDLAMLGLERDPNASDIERKLVWLLWRMASKSAAMAHHEHLVHSDERDGIDVSNLDEAVGGELP